MIACECDSNGSDSISCDSSGKCTCKDGYTTDKCDASVCTPGYYSDGSQCLGEFYVSWYML